MTVTYAQTNLQLFDQLQRDGYSPTELTVICDAYALATRLYSGYFLASGRTEIAHVVGTASIVASLKAPGPVVAAGLIHNVYDNGDFGSHGYGVTAAKRKVIVDTVGEAVEKFVDRFHILRMKRRPLSTLIENIETFDYTERYALLIDLSERLEHQLNDGGLSQYTKYMRLNGQAMVAAAQNLGIVELADTIQAVMTKSTEDNSELRELAARSSGNRSRWIVPASCRKRLTFRLRAAIGRGGRRVGENRMVHRVRRWFDSVCLTK